MIAVALVASELVVIAGGVTAATLVGTTFWKLPPKPPTGRHRMSRKAMQEAELAAIDEWLAAIRKVGDTARRVL